MPALDTVAWYEGINYGQVCPDGSYVEGGIPCPCNCAPNGKELGSPCPKRGGVVCGDPINIATGNSFQQAEDFRTEGDNPLIFARYYNSFATADTRATSLGRNWRSTYDRYIAVVDSTNAPPTALVERADGQVLTFPQTISTVEINGETITSTNWVGDTDVDLKLTATASGWTLTGADDSVETYNADGQLTRIIARHGYAQALERDAANRLQSVTDTFGRQLRFEYEDGLLQVLSTPDGLTVRYGYEASGRNGSRPDRLAAVTYPDNSGSTVTYQYENPDYPFALTGMVDENGVRFTTWTYDGSGRALSSEHAGGADRTTVTYHDEDGTRTVTGPLGGETTFQFYSENSMRKGGLRERKATTTTAAAVSLPSYDANGFVATSMDWNKNQTAVENDPRGLPVSVSEANLRTTTAAYHESFHLPTHTLLSNLRTEFAYDAHGNAVAAVQTDTGTGTEPYPTTGQQRRWTSSFDGTGHRLSVTGPRSDVESTTRFAYQGNHLISVTNALGHVTRFTGYNGRGQPLAVVDANGVTNVFNYDGRGRLLSRTVLSESGNATTDYGYDSAGLLTSVTLPDGSRFFYHYDGAHRLHSVSNSAGETLVLTLDAAGNAVERQAIRSNGSVSMSKTSAFDALGRLIETVNATGNTNRFGYDANGNLLSFEDGRGNATYQTFDALNRVMGTVDPLQNPIGLAYDAFDNPVLVSDPRNLRTVYIRDGFGRIIQESSPDRGVTTYRLDEAGNRVEETDARGVVTLRRFDALNRVVSESYPSSPEENITYAYDATDGGNRGIGRLTGFTDETGSTSLRYDERGNVVGVSRAMGGKRYATAYRYDLADGLTRVTYPSGHVAEYQRDTAGRIASVRFRLSAAADLTPLASGIVYAPFGPIIELTHGNGLVRRNAYDPDYRLVATETSAPGGDSPIQALAYAYDASDNIIAITNLMDEWRSQTFSYDANNRLTSATGSYGRLEYTYDGVGNRLAEKVNGGINDYHYQGGANRLQSVLGTDGLRSFTYTATGNVESDDRENSGNTLYRYGNRNRLQGVLRDGQTLAAYRYDAMGRRGIKVLPDRTIHFHYDEHYRLISESDGATGNTLREYIWLEDMPLAQVEADGTIYFIHCDHLNTPQKMTNPAQAVVWEREQKPFGETIPAVSLTVDAIGNEGKYSLAANGLGGGRYVLEESAALFGEPWVAVSTNDAYFVFDANSVAGSRYYRVALHTGSSGTNAVSNNLRFPGQYYDAETGLHYNMARYYGPSLGRYIEADTIGLNGGINLFGYANANPVANVDPSGTVVQLIVGAGVAIAAVLAPDVVNAPGPCDEIYESNRINDKLAGAAMLLDLVRSGLTLSIWAGTKLEVTASSAAAKTGSELMVHPFSGGGTHITTSARLVAHAESATFGGSSGLFLAPTRQVDALLASGASRSQIEVALGLNQGALSQGALMRIDVANPFARNLSLPTSGNMLFRPGTGMTWGGLNEGIITSPLKIDPGALLRLIP